MQNAATWMLNDLRKCGSMLADEHLCIAGEAEIEKVLDSVGIATHSEGFLKLRV
jgi:hypothetical protein